MVPALAFALPQVRDRIMQVTVDRYSDVSTDYMMAMQRGEFLMIDPVVLNSGKWRSLLWSSSMEWVGDKPIFGYGMDSFKLYSSEFFPLSAGGGSAAHNVFVEQIFEGGIVGIVAYMWIFIAIWLAIFKNFSQRIRDKTTIIIMILSYFIISYSDNILHYLGFNWFFWFVVSSMLANCVQDKDARAA
jgi:O-antigen ligase